MKPRKSREELKNFESSIAEEFNNALIPHPVHLSSGNEMQVIEIFSEIQDGDWVFCSWRSHLHALLKGVPEFQIKEAIRGGQSISLCFPGHKFYSTGIVGGQIPIALGVAISLLRRGVREHVWCFLGDMTSETGMANSCIKYAKSHRLPITFVVEDNGISVCTDTFATWGIEGNTWAKEESDYIRYYKYANSYPHAGAGRRVQF